MKQFYFSKKDVLSGFARWGVRQSPYSRPNNLEETLDQLDSIFELEFHGQKYIKMGYEEIKDFLFKNAEKSTAFVKWNEPKKKSDNPLVGTSSRYWTTKPDYDFIDLYALVRNIANDIIREDSQVSIPLILGKEEVN